MFNTDSGHGDILWWVCYGIVLVCVVCGEILWSQVVNLQSATCMCKNCNSCNFWSDRKLWCAICTIAPKLHLHHYLQLLKKSGKYNNELLLLCQNMRISQYKLNAQKYWFQNRLHAAQCSCSIKIAQKQSFELNFWSSKTQHFPMQLTWKRYKKRAVDTNCWANCVHRETRESGRARSNVCKTIRQTSLSGENNYSEILLRRWQPPIPRRKDPNLHMSSHPAVYGLQYVVNHTDIGNILHLYIFLKIGPFFLKPIYHLTFAKNKYAVSESEPITKLIKLFKKEEIVMLSDFTRGQGMFWIRGWMVGKI